MGGGKPAARQGDMTRKGLDIVQGSAGVLIGAPTGVSHKKGQSELWQPGEPATRCEGSAC
ncbi:putative core protein [Escherichia coli 2-316-03_S3_C1]|nr:putative core protein [Escherichia coli 2-316-03_S3_C1]